VSGNVPCTCELWNKHKNWRVWQRNCNHSAFNGYRRTWSEYSQVVCLVCDGNWRTKAMYVTRLKDHPNGYEGGADNEDR
jgi:hypothetical protein